LPKNKDKDDEVPDGSAFFPIIPPELGVSPLLLGVLHAVVFVGGSADEIVNPKAGDEALGAIAGYLERLDGNDRRRVLEDLAALRGYAREQGWPKQLTAFLKSFPGDFGIEADE
jgi:hypothetical protein